MTYTALKTVLYAAGLNKETSHDLAFDRWGTTKTPIEKWNTIKAEKPLRQRIFSK